MAQLRIAQVGCGGMGLRHLYGQVELKRVLDTFDLVALCDLNESAAEHVAAEAEVHLGARPKVYTSLDDLLDSEKGLDAVDIVTDPGAHHVAALKAFDAGVHVAVEKPLGVTVRACQRMIDGAGRSGLVLSVSENYRRDPMNRLVKAILEAQALGSPRLALNISASGTRGMPHSTAWRHIKLRGGYLLDYAVHNADLFLYFMGDVDRVYAETQLWEEARDNTPLPTSPEMAPYYRHRVREDIEGGEAIEATSEDMAPVRFESGAELARSYRHRVRKDIEGVEAIETTSEDMALALVRFESGAMGQFAMTIAAPGETTRADVIYCNDGSVGLPGSRTGRPVSVTRLGEQAPLSETDTLDLAPGFALDDLTAPFFNGLRRPSSYDMPFPEIDRKLIAIELQDFAESILHSRTPEVTGASGLEAVALVYAILESGLLHQPVSFADVVQDRVNAYQREINESVGL